MEKYTIVCFVWHYVKEFQGQANKRRNIVKPYTNEKMLQMTFSTADKEIPLAPANFRMHIAETQHTEADIQLFTPTTKKILEEISGTSTDALTGQPLGVGVKRNLNFTNTSSNEV
ncbi:hypothetical protein ACH5RR_015225 [Cinchona calisaya]|uniref:Uncharacterized protein n=1 Tax=Cinchona calisaya TaxID=153742 RepID=A0ABD2ZSI5_9GENT